VVFRRSCPSRGDEGRRDFLIRTGNPGQSKVPATGSAALSGYPRVGFHLGNIKASGSTLEIFPICDSVRNLSVGIKSSPTLLQTIKKVFKIDKLLASLFPATFCDFCRKLFI
jgi:hypothetical protein